MNLPRNGKASDDPTDMRRFSPETCAIIVSASSGPPDPSVMQIAETFEILTLIGEDTGTARAGPRPSERTFIRHGGGAFHGSELDLVLRCSDIKSVVFAGGPLGQRVFDAGEAIARGYDAAILADQPQALSAQALISGLFADRPGPGPAVLALDDLKQSWRDQPLEPRSWRGEGKDRALLSTLERRIRPAQTAYLIIDVQNFFCRDPAGSDDGLRGIGKVIANTKVLLDAARASGCTVVFVQAEYGPLFRGPGQPRGFPGGEPDALVYTASASEWGEGDGGRPEVCTAGSWGEQLVDGLEPREGEIRLRKHRFSAFIDTGLEVILRRRGVRSIVIAGVVTNTCVESSTRDAVMLDFYVTVASDAVGVRDTLETLHDNALSEIALDFALTVPSERIREIWSNYREATL